MHSGIAGRTRVETAQLVLPDQLSVVIEAGQAGRGEDDDETATIEALADADPTGFLAAAGMNTFFWGSGATDIAKTS